MSKKKEEYFGRPGYIMKITDEHLSKTLPNYVLIRIPKNKKLSGSERMQQKPIYFSKPPK